MEKTATIPEIKKKFRELAFTFHPDVSGEDSAHDYFVEINEAYQILGNPVKRKNYNLLYEFYYEGVRIKSHADFYKKRFARRNFNAWVEKARSQAKEYAKQKFKEYSRNIDCYFNATSKADGDPYYFYLHKEVGLTGESGIGRGIKYKNITIPIPRGKKAQMFHTIGFGIKFFALVVFVVVASTNMLVGLDKYATWFILLSILIFGGLVCHIMYYLYGVKSVFYFAVKYPRVQEYIKKGYRSGAYAMISASPFGLLLYALRWLL